MWSHQQYVKKTQGRRRFNAETVRSEARQAAREYALQTKGTAHLQRVQTVIKRAKRRQDKQKWLQKVERGLRLQDREITSRKWLLRRGASTGSDFSPAERSELRRWFDALDTDGGGDIDLAELAAPLLSTGIASSLPQVRDIIEKNEMEPGGGIDFESFQRLIKRGVGTDAKGNNLSGQPDNGLSAMQQLRTHVEAAQSNKGLNLDSRINATRRTLLLDALKEIRHSNDESGGKVVFSQQQHQQQHQQQQHQQKERHLLLQQQRLQKRRKKARKAQQKEDKMLALWRVILGSKDQKIAGFHLGDLPPVAMDRGKVYAEWAEKVPRMHADSDVVKHNYQQVNHWLARSCDPNDTPRKVASIDEQKLANRNTVQVAKRLLLTTSQSAPAFDTDQSINEFQIKQEEVKRKKLERMLSAHLRPTRADIARFQKMKERKERGKKITLKPPSMMRELKPRQFPPYSIVASDKLQIRDYSVGVKRRKQTGVLESEND